MPTTLSVIAESIFAAPHSSRAHFTRDLIRALIDTAPEGCDVAAVVASHPGHEITDLHETLPGLTAAHVVPSKPANLARAWRLGLLSEDFGPLVHAPSLIAPLKSHDRAADGTQTVVTIHDLSPWTPEALAPSQARLLRAFAKRAQKHADAVVVPTHALALRLRDHVVFGDRMRVITPAASTTLTPGDDTDERVAALGLPERYVVVLAGAAPHDGLDRLLTGLANSGDVEVAVTGVVDPAAPVVARTEAVPGRVHLLGALTERDRAAVLSRARAFVAPDAHAGSGMGLIEAMSLSVPLVYADAAVLVEVAANSGIEVASAPADDFPTALATAVTDVLGDDELAGRLRVMSHDRSRAFSWRDCAEGVWQLHADL